MKKSVILLILIGFSGCAFAEESGFTSFVYTDGDKVMDENGQVRFISFNIPCLHYNEDNLPFEKTNAWRLPSEFEIEDALEAIKQMGGQVVRIYTLSVARAGEGPETPRHILGPEKFNEEAFQALDMVLAVANRKGIRIIIPFIDNWKWWGGIEACAAFRGKGRDDFWKDAELIEDYKRMVSFVINRRNTVTGVKYRDDKAVFAWETGNELVCPHAWTAKVAAYIKSIDKNHLVMDGYHTTVLRKESIADENIDIVTTHHYSKNPRETIGQIKKSAALARGKKPYVVGEFGFVDTADVRSIIHAAVEEQTVGALIWSLRYRNRDGGFYWHSEPFGGDLFKAYHWPGFESGKAYDERNLVHLMRQKAFEIRNLPLPKVPVPAVPVLLDTDDAALMTWRGSAGAETYIVERAETAEGPWLVVGSNVSDAAVQYRTIFNDASVGIGKSYFYRVKAQNESGVSEASNVIGPVAVRHRTLVDEMQDLRYVHSYDGVLSVAEKQTRRFKEDGHRLAAQAGDSVVYKVDSEINSWKVYAFLPGKKTDLKFYVSGDGVKFEAVHPEKEVYYFGSGDYGYTVPVLYKVDRGDGKSRYLKIEFAKESQISRVEIRYGARPSEITSTHSPTGFIKGFSWGWTGRRGQYLGAAPVESMKKLADTGAGWVCVSFAGEMLKPNEPTIYWAETNPTMVTEDEIRRAISLARNNDLKVILKPVVNVRDGRG
ncbi:MAG: cellulase family glycosylhydrolase [Sedimentisphaerales bacterium]|nr:cellulase family glycosylhydrolase [Sedimentisphaerales bacterium]